MLMQSLGGWNYLAAFLRFNGRVAVFTAKVGQVVKYSEKALVKRFCEKTSQNFCQT